MTKFHLVWLLYFIAKISLAEASDSLSYSGRLVNANGSPVTGPVNLKFDLSYTDAPAVVVCSKTLNAVALTNGVFHVKLDYLAAECGGDAIAKILADTPAGESVAIKLTDLTHSKAYSLQALHSMPFAMMANVSKQLMQMGATNGQVLAWDGTKWAPTAAGGGGGSGTVTSIIAGTGLSGGTITTTGTIGIANLGVDTAQLAASAVTDAKVSATAAIARTKLASGSNSHVLVNDGSGLMSSVAQLPIAQGGTGAATAAAARTALGVMAYDAVPNCLATQKLQMGPGPAYAWTCATDALFDGGPVSAAIDMNSHKITELTAPTDPTDAANKAYVDAQISGVAVTQWSNVAGGHIKYTGGRVGIGTDPAEALDVAANAKIAGNVQIDGKLKLKSDNANFVELQAPAGVAATRTFVWPGVYGTSGQVLTTDGAGALSWTTVASGGGSNWTVSGSDVYRAAGKVGIGTTTPATALEISGGNVRIDQSNRYEGVFSGNPTGYVQFLESAGTTILSSVRGGASSHIQLRTQDAERVRITGAGDVGIGTNAPGSKLDVKGELRLSGSTSGYVGFAPAAAAGSQTYVLPNADGTSGQMLTTNGSGVLSWTTSSGGATSVGGDLTGTVSNAQIAADAVGSAEIANGAVGTTEMADTSVTYAKTNFADGDIPAAKVNGLVAGLAGKEPAITGGANTTYLRGDKTFQTLNTTVVAEGTNLYFLDSRVRDALLTGYVMGTAIPLAAGDSLIQALGKLEASIAAVQASGQWGLASGNVYRTTGNVGVGTASPSQKLDVRGSLRIANTDFAAGTTGTFLDTSLGAASGNTYAQLQGYTNGGVNPANIALNPVSGSVGVGTTAPLSKFHVSGSDATARIESTTEDHGLLLVKSGVQAFGFQVNGAANRLDITNANATYPSTSRLMSITSGGNVGIATSSPSTTLHSVGGAMIDGITVIGRNQDATYDSGGAEVLIDAAAATPPLRIDVGGTEVFRIDSAGKVGVGTASPGQKLTIDGTLPIAELRSGGSLMLRPAANDWDMRIQAVAGNKLNIWSGGDLVNPIATFVHGGRVGIGTTTPAGILDITSTTSGLLIPRMTTTERDAITGTLTGMQVYNTTTNQLNYHNGSSWQVLGTAGAGISSLTAGAGLTGGTITTSGTIAVNVGTGNNQIVQLDGSAKLPAVDGSALTNINPANLSAAVPLTKGGTGLTAAGSANQVLGMNAAGTAAEYKTLSATTPLTLTHGVGTATLALGTVQTASGGTGVTSFTGTRIIGSNAAGTGLVSLSCSVGEVLTFNVSGDYICQSVSSLVASGFINNGNSFAGTATLGTNDANDLVFETNNAAKMTIKSAGNVGIGTSSPSTKLSVAGGVSLVGAMPSDVWGPVIGFGTSGTGSTNQGFIGHLTSHELDLYWNFYRNGADHVSSAANGYTSANGIRMGNSGIQFIGTDTMGTTVPPTNVTIKNDGKVGFGTTSPTEVIDVTGNIRASTSLISPTHSWTNNVTINADSDVDTVGAVQLRTQNVNRLVVANGGNIGIGTVNPSEKLHVEGNIYTNMGEGFRMFGDPSYFGVGLDGIVFEMQDGNNTLGNTDGGFVFRGYTTTDTTPIEWMTIKTPGKVGIGVTNPTAILHLKAGTAAANTAPLMFVAGTNLTTPQNGAMEFDGTNLYITTGGTRKTLSTSGGSSNYVSSGTIATSNATASTSTLTGAVTVAGGMGIGGDVHVGSSTTSPIVYGSTAASGSLILDSTSSGTKGSILMAPTSGNVGVGVGSTPLAKMHVKSAEYANFISATMGQIFVDAGTSTNYWRSIDFGSTASNNNPWARIGMQVTGSGSYLAFGTSNSYAAGVTNQAMTINPTGLVGIGTTSPLAALHVGDGSGALAMSGTSPVAAILGASYSTGLVVRRNGHAEVGLQSGGGGGRLGTWSNHNAIFTTNAVDRMTIDTNGNVGIGMTAPAVGLHVEKDNGNGWAAWIKSSSSSDGVLFGTRSSTASIQSLNSTGASTRSLALNPDGGNVGIGTTSPATKFDVVGGRSTFSAASEQYAVGAKYSSTGGAVYFGAASNSTTPDAAISNAGGATLMTLQNNGNVGIGTATPSDIFHVYKAANARAHFESGSGINYLRLKSNNGGGNYGSSIEFYDGATNSAGISSVASGELRFSTGGAERVMIDSSGNLAIGTTTASAELSIRKANPRFQLDESDAGGNGYTMQVENNIFSLGRYSAQTLNMAGESIGIGTTTPSGKLHVVSTPTIGWGQATAIFTNNQGGGAASAVRGWSVNGGSALGVYGDIGGFDGTNWFGIRGNSGVAGSPAVVGVNTAGGTAAYFSGNVGIGTLPSYTLHVNGSAGKPGGGSWTDSSDRRLKQNIQPLHGALDRLTQLKGVTYEWVNPEDHANQDYVQAGFIAQDVEKVFPKWVERVEAKGNDKKLISANDKVRALHFPHSFNAYVVEAIKELKTKLDKIFAADSKQNREIASLKEENAELKARLDRLEKAMNDKKK